MRSFLILAAVAVIAGWVAIRHLPATEARAESSVVVGDTRIVRSVAIDGRSLPLAALRAVLTTHPGAAVDASLLERDREALANELAGRGYLAAQVDPAVVTRTAEGTFITFQITQGPVFKIRDVDVTGATPRDIGVVTLSAGDAAVASRIERARATLADTLDRRGKRSTVDVTLTTNLVDSVVDVALVAH